MKLFPKLAAIAVLGLTTGVAGALSWNYKTPAAWKNQYSQCGHRYQSPIDFNSRRSQFVATKRLSIHFMAGHYRAQVVNTGYDIELLFPGERPEVAIGKTYYRIMNLHFHETAEHALNGHHYPAELHFMLTQAGAKPEAALAIWLDCCRANPVIGQLLRRASHRTGNKSASFTFNAHDFDRLIPTRRSYFQYQGTLTAPPCTRISPWIVFRHPLNVSGNQLKTLNSFYPDNHRPTQDLNGRQIKLTK